MRHLKIRHGNLRNSVSIKGRRGLRWSCHIGTALSRGNHLDNCSNGVKRSKGVFWMAYLNPTVHVQRSGADDLFEPTVTTLPRKGHSYILDTSGADEKRHTTTTTTTTPTTTWCNSTILPPSGLVHEIGIWWNYVNTYSLSRSLLVVLSWSLSSGTDLSGCHIDVNALMHHINAVIYHIHFSLTHVYIYRSLYECSIGLYRRINAETIFNINRWYLNYHLTIFRYNWLFY